MRRDEMSEPTETQVEYKGKTYRVSQTMGFKDSIINHIQVLRDGAWRFQSARSATANAVLRLAAEKIAAR
jgi:hypothetical protein